MLTSAIIWSISVMTVGISGTACQLCSTFINIWKTHRKLMSETTETAQYPNYSTWILLYSQTYLHTCCHEESNQVYNQDICNPVARSTSYMSGSKLQIVNNRNHWKTKLHSCWLSSCDADWHTSTGSYTVICTFLSVIAISTALAQMAWVSRVANTISITKASALPLTAT